MGYPLNLQNKMVNLRNTKTPLSYIELVRKLKNDLGDRKHFLDELYNESDDSMKQILGMEIEDVVKLQKLLTKLYK